jgi:hypothetical protein
MRRGVISLFFLSVALSGCVSLRDQWQVTVREDKERGAKPAHYQAAIDAYLGSTLKDPFSAQQKDVTPAVEAIYTTTTVTQAPTLVNVNGRKLEERRWVWLITAQVNAKNSYGGYVGWRTYKFYFQSEKLIAADGG